MRINTALRYLAPVAMLALWGEVSDAQGTRGTGARVAVTIAFVDELPVPDAPFVVQRRPGVAPHDVILLRDGATGADLTAAIQTLQTARQAGGDFPAREGIVRMRPRQQRARARPELPWANRVLADLRSASHREVAGVGKVKAVEIWLPSQQRGRRS